jgi:hypothetical protein
MFRDAVDTSLIVPTLEPIHQTTLMHFPKRMHPASLVRLNVGDEVIIVVPPIGRASDANIRIGIISKLIDNAIRATYPSTCPCRTEQICLNRETETFDCSCCRRCTLWERGRKGRSEG